MLVSARGLVLITNNASRGKWPKKTRHVSCSIKSLPMPGIRDLFLVRRACGQLMTQCWRSVNRSGNYPESGNTTIATGGKRVSPSFMVSNNFEQTWKQFEKHGCLVSTSKTFGNGFHGDEAVNVTVEPGIERTLGFGAVLSRQRFQRYALRINNYRSTLYLKRTIRKKS